MQPSKYGFIQMHVWMACKWKWHMTAIRTKHGKIYLATTKNLTNFNLCNGNFLSVFFFSDVVLLLLPFVPTVFQIRVMAINLSCFGFMLDHHTDVWSWWIFVFIQRWLIHWSLQSYWCTVGGGRGGVPHFTSFFWEPPSKIVEIKWESIPKKTVIKYLHCLEKGASKICIAGQPASLTFACTTMIVIIQIQICFPKEMCIKK